MMREEVIHSTSAQPENHEADRAPAAVARPKGSWVVGPTVLALCCLFLILFVIAATIVLSLIPVYLATRDATAAGQTITVSIPVSTDLQLPVGDLNAAQIAVLQQYLQQQQGTVSGGNTATLTVKSATGIASGGSTGSRRRAVRGLFASILRAVILFLRILAALLRELTRAFERRSLPGDVCNSIKQVASPTTTTTVLTTTTATTTVTTTITTTVTTTTTTTANVTRSLVRRSIEDGGAPAGRVYIDSHQIAATNGYVSSVSFYVDQSCALATVEFGAFNLINRNLEMNEAELVLTHRSGSLQLGTAKELKSYMNLITIQLCNPNAMYTENGGPCKGTKFPVASHQYLGVRSDKCRLGFAPTPTNPLHATTWRPDVEADPFAEPYQTIKYVPSDYTVLHTVNIETTDSQSNKPIKSKKVTETKAPRVLFIGSYPPRRCGIAKFLEDLADNYQGLHDVIAVNEREADMATRTYSDKVIYYFNQTDRDEYFKVANMINVGAYDVLNIQHEYGIFGGANGEYVLNLLSSVKKPVITTLHTVIPDPNPFMIGLTRAIVSLSSRVIILANVGRRLLVDIYGIDESKITILPHGVPDVPFAPSLADAKTKLGFDANVPIMATFGLIHKNKNIQFALQALQTAVKLVPNILYLVIGQTHPLILKYEGEVYRSQLEANVSALGLTNNVRFVNKFVDDNEILSYLAASDIYLTPYAREDQYVSGTLSWAVGLGKVVVSTPYLYAKELLADGRGFLVPFNDPDFLGSIITKVVLNDEVRNAARREAYKYGRRMAWPHVAKELEEIFREELLFT